MKSNPDDRSNNVERIQENIRNTKENTELANSSIDITSNDKTKQEIKSKNKRREKAIESMENELKDEIEYRENN